MSPRKYSLVLALLAAPLAVNTAPAQQVDTTGAGRLITQAMDHSEVMANLRHLSDAIGPRLSGSPAMRRANDWGAERFRSYGLTASLEAFPFGVTWTRGPISARLVAPFERPVIAYSWAWTVGTGGQLRTGPIVRADINSPESLAASRDRIRGAWVMLNDPAFVWNPDGPAMTAADSADRRAALERRRAERAAGDTSAAARERARQFSADRNQLLADAGVLGVITDGGKEHTLLTMSGSPFRVSPLPNIVVPHEDFLMFSRQVEAGLAPRLAVSIENTIGTAPVEQWNTIGEIRGSEKPDEVVIVGAHYDSWDLSQGVTDNGASSMAVLEAARIIQASGLRPKRTIRFILFGGEEQGLIGSRAYAEQHASEAAKVQAVLVLDNGTGAITGQALQGRTEFEQLWKDLLAPVASLGASNVRPNNKGGTDHLAFVPYGIPAFNYDQISRGYDHTHHSQSDSYDKAVEGDLKQAAAVMAVNAYMLANLEDLLPRGEIRD